MAHGRPDLDASLRAAVVAVRHPADLTAASAAAAQRPARAVDGEAA